MTGLQQVSSPTFLLPAYGRKYATIVQALQDWNAGKDFKIYGGPYCSIRDITELRETSSNIYLVIVDDHIKV